MGEQEAVDAIRAASFGPGAVFTLERTLLAAAATLALSQQRLAHDAVPAAVAGQSGGLDTRSPLVAENFFGVAPLHDQQASLDPGWVAPDASPGRIRSGQTSIRTQIQPGDCGFRIGGGGQDDCAASNERIDIASEYVAGDFTPSA